MQQLYLVQGLLCVCYLTVPPSYDPCSCHGSLQLHCVFGWFGFKYGTTLSRVWWDSLQASNAGPKPQATPGTNVMRTHSLCWFQGLMFHESTEGPSAPSAAWNLEQKSLLVGHCPCGVCCGCSSLVCVCACVFDSAQAEGLRISLNATLALHSQRLPTVCEDHPQPIQAYLITEWHSCATSGQQVLLQAVCRALSSCLSACCRSTTSHHTVCVQSAGE